MSNNKQACHANLHMTPTQFAVWEVCRRLAHQHEGIYRMDGRHLATLFVGISKSAIYRTIETLEEEGWFELDRPKSKDPKTGRWLSTYYRVLTPKEWGQKHPHTHGSGLASPSRTSETGTSPTSGTGPVPPVGHVQSQNSESPVPPVGHSYSSYIDLTTTTTDGEKQQGREGPSIMAKIQEVANRQIRMSVKTGQQDPKRAEQLESRVGRELLLRTWAAWLFDEKNLYFTDGGERREYLFTNFVDSGDAEFLAGKYAPTVKVGFTDAETIHTIYAHRMKLGDNLLPDEITLLEDMADLPGLYANLRRENPNGTLKDLAQSLTERERATEQATERAKLVVVR